MKITDSIPSSLKKIVYSLPGTDDSIWQYVTTIWQLVNQIKSVHEDDYYSYRNNHHLLKFIDTLVAKGLDIPTLFKSSILDKDNSNIVFEGFNFYCDYLSYKKEKMPIELTNFYLKRVVALPCHESSVIGNFIKIINLSPLQISYDSLMGCLDKLTSLHRDYDDQKIIYDYIKDLFPDKLEAASQYYKDIHNPQTFAVSRDYGASMEINIYQLKNQYGADDEKIRSIIISTFNIVWTNDFQTIIEKHYDINSVEIKNQSNNNLTLKYRSCNMNDLEIFENCLKNTFELLLDDVDSLPTEITPQVINSYIIKERIENTLKNNSQSYKKTKI